MYSYSHTVPGGDVLVQDAERVKMRDATGHLQAKIHQLSGAERQTRALQPDLPAALEVSGKRKHRKKNSIVF